MTMESNAETPSRGPFSMADMVGFMMRDLFSHGINMEEHLTEAQQGARNLGFQLGMAHKAMEEGEATIRRQGNEIDELHTQLGEALGLLGEAKDMLRPFEQGDSVKAEWLAKCAGARAAWEALHSKGNEDASA